ncbi:hypothetical protein DAH66_14900 [Sphingomonas koreensis]|uniref:Uncharacterized protein n=1 Tax=Sphingomonas koreensis TaxID=93064 RepID=A0A430G1S9_9SPHN|nr:hypothetical protein [Sphingomonas koreensis]RSY81529.1 hypothetical protein DAH66_14900 [Sphingomonas koreensis]
MTFVTFSNALVMLLCVAVIVQTLRVSRSIHDLRATSLGDSVTQLERATGQARAVLGELRTLLANEAVAQSRGAANSEALRDELAVMVGIGNSVADRIMEAVAAQNEAQALEAAAKEASVRRQRKPRSRTASGRRKATGAVKVPTVTAAMPVAGHA